MAKIITYNNPLTGDPDKCFCQMRFDDGARILISQSQQGIKIFSLFIGVIPRNILWHADYFNTFKHDLFLNGIETKVLLMDMYIERIRPMHLSSELLTHINGCEQRLHP